MNAVSIIQARASSTRLPGKVLMPILGVPMLQLMLRRLEESPIPVVLATSTEASDDPVAELGEQVGVRVVRGSLSDVLSRFLKVVDQVPADVIVRMTADNPLSDAAGVHAALAAFETRAPGMRGVSNHLSHRWDPHGYAYEVVETEALREIAAGTPTADEREHVTFGLRARGTYGEFSISPVDVSHLRWTVDFEADYRYMEQLFRAVGADATFDDALEWSRHNPHPGIAT